MKIGILTALQLLALGVALFGTGVCIGAHPGARRIADMSASERRLKASIEAMWIAMLAYWLLMALR